MLSTRTTTSARPARSRSRRMRAAYAVAALAGALTVVLGGGLGGVAATTPAAARAVAPPAATADPVTPTPAEPPAPPTTPAEPPAPPTTPTTPAEPPTSSAPAAPTTTVAPPPTSASAPPPVTETPSTPESPSAAPAEPAQRPATPPAVSTSSVPTLSIAIALVVLALTGAFMLLVHRRDRAAGTEAATGGGGPRDGTAAGGGPDTLTAVVPTPTVAGPATVVRGPRTERTATDLEIVTVMITTLGEAMIDAGDPANHVQDCLREVARVAEVDGAGIIVLPTAIMVSVPGADTVQTTVTAAGTSSLRLDQVDAVFRVAHDAQHVGLPPAQALSRLRAARAAEPPFGTAARMAGQVVLSLGLALVLGGTELEAVVAAGLGALVGAAQLATPRLPDEYRVFLPFVSAFAVSVAVFLLARTGLHIDPFPPLVAPLVMFLPGALLTTSVIELATGQMISGAARLLTGVLQLTMLALAIVAAAQLVGIPATTVSPAGSVPLRDLSPWVGVALFGAGMIVRQCARTSSAGWIMLVLYVAYAGQVFGGLLLGGVLSAFIGALLMTPVAAFAATRPLGPPTLVTFLPAFWLLVPGALGLVGVTKVLGNDRLGGFDALLTTGATMIGIALGVLLGLAAVGTVTSLSDSARPVPVR